MNSTARGTHSPTPIVLAWLLGAMVAATTQACTHVPSAPPAGAAALTAPLAGYGQLPLAFEANQGQSDAQVRFLARGEGYGLFLTSTEAVLSLRAPAASSTVVRMKLVGANSQPAIAGFDPLAGATNYLIGSDPDQWRRDVPTYARVKYTSVYPGIDLVYYGKQRQLEYDFVVGPNADPSIVALAFDGVDTLSIDPEGNLILQTAHGALTQQKPVVYQDLGGRRHLVDGRYELRADDRVGFHVSSYDHTHPLVIDPVLSYSTYLGGNGNDVGNAIAVDGAGNAYVTGSTQSTNFPGASGSLVQASLRGSADVFVAKLNTAGTALVYSTYLGGSGSDIGRAIAVDGAGNAYVTGETDSPTTGSGAIPFPLVGPIQPIFGLIGDAFVTKLNAAGNALVYSTYLGGSGSDRGYGIALDGVGNAYVTGHTNSLNFPIAAAFQPANAGPGSYDAFVAKLNPAGSFLVYSTYLGGLLNEFSLDGGAIAVDSAGSAYVGGTTASANFPGAGTSTIQATFGGGTADGFVVKFNAAGSALVYSTYLGGTTVDAVNGLALDAGQNAYVVGYTDSSNFPTAVPLQATRNGPGNDAFVAKLNAAGSTLAYSTYLGGTGGDVAYDVAVDSGGNASVSGWTSSFNYPTVVPLQASNAGSGDAFISQLNSAGSALTFSTYWGGSSGVERGYGIALDSFANIYVAGETNSSNFPASTGAFQTSLAGFTDAFVAKISPTPTVLRAPTNLTATSIVGNTVTLAWTAPANSITPTGYLLEGGVSPGEVLGSVALGGTATTFTFAAPTGAFYVRVHSSASGARSVASNEIRIFVNVPAPPSAPTNLLGLAIGSSLQLAWQNTAAGGTPTGLILDVTGSGVGSLSLPLSEDFVLAGGVPAGTYTLSLRAVNATGISGSSNSVTLTFPGACSGAPATPTNFVATTSGNVLSLSWGLPASGSAPSGYTLIVTGSFVGSLPLGSGRSIAGAVPSGSYTLSIAATNACGTSAATPAQTVTIP